MNEVNPTPVPSGQAPNHGSVPVPNSGNGSTKPASPWNVPELDELRESIHRGLKFERDNVRDIGSDLRKLKSGLKENGTHYGMRAYFDLSAFRSKRGADAILKVLKENIFGDVVLTKERCEEFFNLDQLFDVPSKKKQGFFF